MKRRRIIGYGLGEAANEASYASVSLLLLSYYTDVVAMNAAIAGIVLMVVRVIDAGFDLFAGRVIDRTFTRWGKARPFLLAGGLPMALMGVGLFAMPELGRTGQIIYAGLTFTLFGLAYAFSQVSLGTLAAAMTREPRERDRLAMARSTASFFVYLLLYAVIVPSLEGVPDLGTAYLFVVGGASVISVVFFVCAFALTREEGNRDAKHESVPVTLRQSIAAVRVNRPLIVLCAGMVFMLIGFEAFNFGALFYARFLAGGFDAFIVMAIPISIGQGLFGWLTPRITARLGKRRTYVVAGVVAAAGHLTLLLVRPDDSWWFVLVMLGVASAGSAVVQTVLFSMQADTVEYGQWRTGHRAEGATYAFFSFARRCGNAVASGLAGFALAGSGYVADAATQPSGALWGILALVGLVPAVGYLLAAVCMGWYRLTEAEHRRIVAEIEASADGHKEDACSPLKAS
ncbi:glycoside-pentoside-hexuronide (GPH):cation symporter [Glycomyces sp. A-F 0318]|uniref:glycoside-pentoside-hexuronide (GPH):cation symporter n=1 Tax=Glycomyces amatae TaxID=2881355 RepID=UPI001E5CF333|nr:glycoside-pentoside-hexuronide (GPH):cation symporter [Glycomyces amatae]